MDRKNQVRLARAVFFGGVLAPLLLFLGLKAALAAPVSLRLPLELVATAVLGTLLFSDHLGKFGWLGMAGVLAGGVLLSLGETNAGISAGLLALGACACCCRHIRPSETFGIAILGRSQGGCHD